MGIETGLFVCKSGVLELIASAETELNKDLVVTPLLCRKFINPDEFMSIMSKPMSSQLLPNNCKFITNTQNNNYTSMIIEEPPRIRTVKIKASVLAKEIERLRKNGKMKEYKIDEFLTKSEKIYQGDVYYELSLSFPYVIFLISLGFYQGSYSNSCSKVYLRTSPMKSLNDRIITSPTTNFDGHNLCSTYQNGPTIKGVAESIVSGFWNALFTEHGSTYYFQYLDRDINVSSWLVWHYLTLKDPNFVFSEDWMYHPHTIETELGNMLYRSNNIHGFIDMFMENDVRKMDQMDLINYHEYLFRLNNHQILLAQGDEIEIDGKIYFIECFGRKRSSNDPIMFLDPLEDGEAKIQIDMNTTNQEKILKQKIKKEITEIEVKGKKIKCGDVISYRYLGSLRSGLIKKIRKNRLGMLEVKLSGNFFNLLTDEFIDTYEVKFDGSKNLNKKFIVEILTGLRRPAATAFYEGELIDAYESGEEVSFRFKDLKGAEFSFPSQQCLLHTQEEFTKGMETYPVIESNGLLYINCKWSSRDGYEYFIKENRLFTRKHVRSETYYHINNQEDIEEALNKILTKDGINIKSTTHDININLGDTVCVFEEIGKITVGRVIRLIKNLERCSIDIEIEDANRTKTIHQYAKILSNRHYAARSFANGCINNLSVIKLHPMVDNIVAGSKIISKLSRIPNFSKGNVNKIMGFILDFGCPLIVASNGQTIWYDENFKNVFDVINPSDKKYNLKKYQLNYKLGNYTPMIGDITQYGSDEKMTIFEIIPRGVNCFMTNAPEITYSIYKKDIRPVGLLFPRFINNIKVETNEGDNNNV